MLCLTSSTLQGVHTHIHIHIQAFLHAFHLHNNGLGKSKIFFMQSETTATNCWMTCGYLLLPLLVPATRSSTWPSNVFLLSLGSRIAPSPGLACYMEEATPGNTKCLHSVQFATLSNNYSQSIGSLAKSMAGDVWCHREFGF
jgi:hypothetical protein